MRPSPFQRNGTGSLRSRPYQDASHLLRFAPALRVTSPPLRQCSIWPEGGGRNDHVKFRATGTPTLCHWACNATPGSYSAVKLTCEKTAIEKMVYAITNPVDAGLVSESHQWPGICTQPRDIGTSQTIDRPKKLFRDQGPLPESATLRTRQGISCPFLTPMHSGWRCRSSLIYRQ